MNQKNITIGIPSYKRIQSLIKLIEQILSLPVFYQNVNVIIINDSGTEKHKYEYINELNILRNKDACPDIQLIHNENNLGFPRTIIKLLKSCQTQYLLLMADDDLLIEDNFLDVLKFLDEKNPALLSPQWLYKNGKLGRGINKTRKIKPEEHRVCSGHVPGLIVDTVKFKEFIPLVEQRINMQCAATLTYPMVAFAIPMFLKFNNFWWFGYPIAKEGDALQSGIKDAHGNTYSSLASRIQQIAAFDSFILSFNKCKTRDRILKESRIWSIKKAVMSDYELKRGVINHISPSFLSKIQKRVSRYFKNTTR